MNLALLADQNLAQYGEYARLWFEGRTYTNRELHDLSCRLAGGLQRLGLGPDDRVVVMMGNCPEVLVSYPGIWRMGGVAIPVLHALEARELAYILSDAAARAIITSADLVPKVQQAIALSGREGITVIAVTEGKVEAPSPALGFESWLAASEPLTEPVARERDDLAVVLYTSGTTGRPKGVMQSHNNLHAQARNSWNTAKTKDPTESALVVLPLAHTFGLSTLLAGYLFGGRGVLLRKFMPEEALALIAQHKTAVMAAVPTMYLYMLMTPGAWDTSSMRVWVVGGASMPIEQLQQFERRFGGTMHVGYGLTEASPTIAAEREGEPRKPGSTGRPVEGVRVKIVDDEGRTLPTGAVGEVCAAGENITLGYLGMPEETAQTFRDGWLHTGDLGYLDEDGLLFIVGRKKDLIIRGGLNVYPQDVEEVLHRHPAVQECAVIGVPDVLMGEQVCACVVLRDGAATTAEALIEHCQASLAKYKTPRYVEFRRELPKTQIGKVQKKELRAWASKLLAQRARAQASASA